VISISSKTVSLRTASPVAEAKSLPTTDALVWLICILFIALGFSERIVGLGYRSFWVDEAWVANLINADNYLSAILHDKAGYWGPMPLLFVLSTKVAVVFLGNNEWAFRLMPCLFGLGALIVVGLLAREAFGQSNFWLVPVALLSVNPNAIYYSKELKQYSGELFFSSALLYLTALLLKRKGTQRKVALLYFVAGLFAIGFGIPVVFVIAATSVFIGLQFCARREWEPLLKAALIAFVLGVSSITIYLLWLRPQGGGGYPLFWERTYFMPKEVLELPWWFLNRGLSFFTTDFGFPTMVLGKNLVFRNEYLFCYIAGFASCLGILRFIRSENKWLVFVYGGILGTLILLSIFHAWPFGGSRVNLFLLPFHLLFIGGGIQVAATFLNRYAKTPPFRWCLVGMGVLTILPIHSLDENLWHLRKREELRPIVEYLKSNFEPERQRIYVYLWAGEAFRYYWGRDSRLQDPSLYHIGSSTTPVLLEEEAEYLTDLENYLQDLPDTVEEIYVAFSHIYRLEDRPILAYLRDRFGDEIDTRQDFRAALYLFRIKGENEEKDSSV
jgi:hypothetical protein